MPVNELLDIVSVAAPDSTGCVDPHRISAAEPEHLTLDETAEWLRCSTRTLQRLLETGSGPPVIRLSERRLIFRVADLRTWLAARTTGYAEIAPRRRRGRPPSKRPAL
jgi:predicted DNA-binding transcriptional regulator AlpA